MTKPRAPGIFFKFDKQITLDGIKIWQDGRMSFVSKGGDVSPAQAAVELTYDRKKGRKVLTRAPVDPSAMFLNPNQQLLNYDFIFGIDTNTKEIRGSRVSVSCVCHLALKKEQTEVWAKSKPLGAFELHEVKGEPERIAWRMFCEAILRDNPNETKKRVAIVVDSALDLLMAINERQVPVEGDWYLPGHFSLLYATSDSATSSIANRLIAECDRHARYILQQVAENRTTQELVPGEPQDSFSHFRNWSYRGRPEAAH